MSNRDKLSMQRCMRLCFRQIFPLIACAPSWRARSQRSEMKRRGVSNGLATLCIGGGTGGAMCAEAV